MNSSDTFKIYISWSGEPSKTIALAISSWLADVFRGMLQIRLSDEQISGAGFSQELDEFIDTADAAIFCFTSNNISSGWIKFDAGRFDSQDPDTFLLVPFLFNVAPDEIIAPLQNRLVITNDRTSFYRLVIEINSRLRRSFDVPELNKNFENLFPHLEVSITRMRGHKELLGLW